MSRRLPPLNALRVFEAAARHLSFTKAAEELHVTQAAISHQVKLLEDVLGVTLFRRLNRRLVLTDAGQTYMPPLRDAFDQMAAATRRLAQSGDSGALRISTIQSFAAKFLMPRVPRFRAKHPDIELMISASTQLVDFRRDDVDIGIRLGRGEYPDLHVTKLMDDYIFPVCSPALLRGPHPLRSAEDLKHHTLLHDTAIASEEESPTWRNWLRHAGVSDVDGSRGPGFSDAAMAIQAAIAGQGVALGRPALVVEDLAAGHLVRPFEQQIKNRYSYYLVCAKTSADQPKQRAFRDWMLEEIARSGL